MMIKTIYGYIGANSDKRTVESQRYEIIQFCEKSDWHIDGWIEETISGTKNYDKRKLGLLLDKAVAGGLILCAELSRLVRSPYSVFSKTPPRSRHRVSA